MKKILILFSACFFPYLALANSCPANGFYLGGNLILAKYDPIDGAAVNSSLFPVVGFIQPYLGYRFNSYFAIQGAFSYLVNDHNDGGTTTKDFLGNDEKWGPDHYVLYTVELTPKIIYSFSSGFSIYAKAGVAYVHQDVFNQTYESSPPSVNSQANKILPVAGAGINYNFTPHFACEISFTHIQGIQPIGNIQIFGLGINYTF